MSRTIAPFQHVMVANAVYGNSGNGLDLDGATTQAQYFPIDAAFTINIDQCGAIMTTDYAGNATPAILALETTPDGTNFTEIATLNLGTATVPVARQRRFTGTTYNPLTAPGTQTGGTATSKSVTIVPTSASNPHCGVRIRLKQAAASTTAGVAIGVIGGALEQ